jgi:elongation factor 1 alpha-like protein
MAHRRVKDIDYDEDEYEEYYSGEEEYGYDDAESAPAPAVSQEDELSPEDKEQMRKGTENVRAALGDAADFVTDDAIQEALWHYYYDVAKSVTYLKSNTDASHVTTQRSCLPDQNAPQQAQPKEKKQKQVSKFDQAATEAAQKPVDIKGTSIIFSSSPSLFFT